MMGTDPFPDRDPAHHCIHCIDVCVCVYIYVITYY